MSLLAERAGMLVAAANNALHAAWACDDANEIEAACVEAAGSTYPELASSVDF